MNSKVLCKRKICDDNFDLSEFEDKSKMIGFESFFIELPLKTKTIFVHSILMLGFLFSKFHLLAEMVFVRLGIIAKEPTYVNMA